jgi:hypothetical protein
MEPRLQDSLARPPQSVALTPAAHEYLRSLFPALDTVYASHIP